MLQYAWKSGVHRGEIPNRANACVDDMKQSKPKAGAVVAKRSKSSSSESARAADTNVTQVTDANQPTHTVHAFGPSCTIRDCGALKAALEALMPVHAVTFDVNALERIDTAALQLLAAFVKDRQLHARTVQWRGNAANFYDAVNISGLGFTLDLSKRDVGATT